MQQQQQTQKTTKMQSKHSREITTLTNQVMDTSRTETLITGYIRKIDEFNQFDIPFEINSFVFSYYSSYIALGTGLNDYGFLGIGKWKKLYDWTVLNDLSNRYTSNTLIFGGYYKIAYKFNENSDYFICGCNVSSSLGINKMDKGGHGSCSGVHNKKGDHVSILTKLNIDPILTLTLCPFARHSFIFDNIKNELYGFGSNTECSLGIITEDSKHQVPSPKYLKELNNFLFIKNKICIKKIKCGSNFSLILTKNGNVYSFGSNNYRECGHLYRKTESNMILIPRKIHFGINNINELKEINFKVHQNDNSLFNKDIINKICIMDIFCGGQHSLAIDKDNNLWCWGRNYHGQLGLADQNVRSPRKNKWYKNKNILYNDIICGDIATSIITNDGKCYIFGFNGTGNSPQHKIFSPYPLFDKNKKLNDKIFIQKGSMGKHHSLYLTNDNKLYGIGSNEYYQLSPNVLFNTSGQCDPILLSKDDIGIHLDTKILNIFAHWNSSIIIVENVNFNHNHYKHQKTFFFQKQLSKIKEMDEYKELLKIYQVIELETKIKQHLLDRKGDIRHIKQHLGRMAKMNKI
eukprot:186115_1